MAGGGARPRLAGGVDEQDLVRGGPVAVRRQAPSARQPRSGSRRVLLLWGAGGRDTDASAVDAARRATPGWTWTERSPDRPSPDLWAELCAADVVVTHAGQNAVADVAAARAPAVVVAQRRPFGEQAATARALSRLDIADGHTTWPSADRWDDVLEAARRRGGEGWARWSSGHGARDAAARLDALAAGQSSLVDAGERP